MRKTLLFYLFAVLLTALPQSVKADTWVFEWDKSHSDATAQGFYNFGSTAVDKDVYTEVLNSIVWNITSVGTKKYAYTAKSGQSIGTTSEPSSHTSLWTTGFAGTIKAVRVTARTNKDANVAALKVSVDGKALLTGTSEAAALNGTLTQYEFKASSAAQEGKLEITLDPTSESQGTLYIKRIEVDYDAVQSSVPTPTITPAAGTYDDPQSISIAVSGLEQGKYKVYYTTDGTNPRLADGTRQEYTEPFTISASATVKAVTLSGEEYSAVAQADYVIRQDPQIHFNKEAISLISGEDAYSDLINPNKVSPITYKSSAWNVCSVDKYGELASSYVKTTQTVTITASFAGDATYKPATATMQVTVVAKEPLSTPVVTPLGGTYTEPVDVTITTDDDRAVTIWYSTTAKDAEEFEDDYTKSVITEGKSVTLTIDKSCTLYVMTRGDNVNSEVVTAQYVVNLPLKADFTTDKAKTPYLTQNFDTAEDLRGWTLGEGWEQRDKGFSAIDASDQASLFIPYDAGSTSTVLESPVVNVESGSSVEFYAYFSGGFLVYGKWTFSITDTDTNVKETLFNAFDWAQDNAYDGPNWNKFSFDLANYVGKNVKFTIDYPFGGEDLTLDGFRVVKDNPAAKDQIRIFEGETVKYSSMSQGEPESVEWTFEGGTPAKSTDTAPVVTYDKAGTYAVTLTVKRGDETDTTVRNAFVVVAQKAPTAQIGLPEEGYESPYVGVFVPTNVPVVFRDLSTGNPTEWNWKFQFADKESSNEQNPTVTFVKKGTVSVGLTAKNASGQSNDIRQYAVQAGGAQNVWNISTDDNSKIEKITLGFYGNYAGSNWLGIEKFAELYKAPLADAKIESVDVFFASNTTVDPEADITLTINAVGADGNPGEELGSASLKLKDLKYDDVETLPTKFTLNKAVVLKKGTPFFVVVGPMPHKDSDVSPYSDDIAIFCVRNTDTDKHTVWQYQEDEDDNYHGLGTYSWVRNVDESVSMAIAPIVDYEDVPTAISTPSAAAPGIAEVAAVYTLDGKQVGTPQTNGIYIVRYTDGTSRKVMWK